jgi:hypothetical protein
MGSLPVRYCIDKRGHVGVASGRSQTRREDIPVDSLVASLPPTVCYSPKLHPA